MLSGRIAEAHGHRGLAPDTIRIDFSGVAGQSFGAWLAHGVALSLTGDANDYVGKGLSGGRLIVRRPDEAPREPGSNIIVGNTVRLSPWWPWRDEEGAASSPRERGEKYAAQRGLPSEDAAEWFERESTTVRKLRALGRGDASERDGKGSVAPPAR